MLFVILGLDPGIHPKSKLDSPKGHFARLRGNDGEANTLCV